MYCFSSFRSLCISPFPSEKRLTMLRRETPATKISEVNFDVRNLIKTLQKVYKDKREVAYL